MNLVTTLMAGRRYSEAELAQILKNASLRELDSATEDDGHAGFSLEDVQKIGQEVGLDPIRIREEAERIEAAGIHANRSDDNLVFERTFDGSLSDEQWEEIVAELRQATEAVGTVSTLGSSREWNSGNEFVGVHFSASPRKGATRVRLTAQQAGGKAMAWMFGGIGAFLACLISGAIIAKSGYGGWAVLMAVIGILLLVGTLVQTIVRKWSRNNRANLARVMDRIEECMAADELRTELSRAQAPTAAEEALPNPTTTL